MPMPTVLVFQRCNSAGPWETFCACVDHIQVMAPGDATVALVAPYAEMLAKCMSQSPRYRSLLISPYRDLSSDDPCACTKTY